MLLKIFLVISAHQLRFVVVEEGHFVDGELAGVVGGNQLLPLGNGPCVFAETVDDEAADECHDLAWALGVVAALKRDYLLLLAWKGLEQGFRVPLVDQLVVLR